MIGTVIMAVSSIASVRNCMSTEAEKFGLSQEIHYPDENNSLVLNFDTSAEIVGGYIEYSLILNDVLLASYVEDICADGLECPAQDGSRNVNIPMRSRNITGTLVTRIDRHNRFDDQLWCIELILKTN